MLSGTKVSQTHGSSNYPTGMNENLAVMICEKYDASPSDGQNPMEEGSKEEEMSPYGAGVVRRNPPSFSPAPPQLLMRSSTSRRSRDEG